MNLAAGVAATHPLVKEADEVSTPAPSPATREVHRLADALLPSFLSDRSHCVLLLDLDVARTTSFWLATSVGAALGTTLKTSVYVISTAAPALLDSRLTTQALSGGGCLVESLRGSDGGEDRASLVERLAELRSAERPVLLHADKEGVLPEGFLQGGAVDGVVLLARAARTRRAALQATVRRMSLASVPLLGCVLLDRTHPIPEKLYQLL